MGLQESVSEPLTIALGMVVRHEMPDRALKRCRSEEDHSAQQSSRTEYENTVAIPVDLSKWISIPPLIPQGMYRLIALPRHEIAAERLCYLNDLGASLNNCACSGAPISGSRFNSPVFIQFT